MSLTHHHDVRSVYFSSMKETNKKRLTNILLINMKKKHYSDVEEQEVTDYGSTGTTIRWLITKDKNGALRFSIRRFEIKPGGQIGIHDHPQEHEIYILSGKGEVFSHFEKTEIKTDNVLFVQPNERHGYKNTGDENLIFLCVIPYLE